MSFKFHGCSHSLQWLRSPRRKNSSLFWIFPLLFPMKRWNQTPWSWHDVAMYALKCWMQFNITRYFILNIFSSVLTVSSFLIFWTLFCLFYEKPNNYEFPLEKTLMATMSNRHISCAWQFSLLFTCLQGGLDIYFCLKAEIPSLGQSLLNLCIE